MSTFERPEIKITIPSSIKLYEDLAYADAHPRQNLHLMRSSQNSDKLPLIIYIHGGAWNHGNKDLQLPHLLPYAISGDFVTVAINYRFSQHKPWPAQINDCKAALDFLIHNSDKYGIDSSRISIWGSSSGAHLALHLANDPSVTSVLAYCPPSHFRPLLDILEYEEHALKTHILPNSPVIQLIGKDPVDFPELLLDASPLEHLKKSSCPILLAHGTKDEPVPYEQSLAFMDKAKELKVNCKLITLDGYGHKFDNSILDNEVKNFFYYHLHDKGFSPENLTIT